VALLGPLGVTSTRKDCCKSKESKARTSTFVFANFLSKTLGQAQCKYAFFKKRRNKTDRLTLLGTLEEEEATALQEWPTSFLPTL